MKSNSGRYEKMKIKILKISCGFLLYVMALSFFVIGQYLIIVTAVGQSNMLYGG